MCITEDKLVESYETGLFNRILFEAEYLPGYWDYYKELKRNPNIDILLLGQHLYAIGEDKYSFSFS